VAETRKPPRRRFAFYRQLSRSEQQEYDRSDALRSVPLRPSDALRTAAEGLLAGLAKASRSEVRLAAQDLVEQICRGVGLPAAEVPRVRVLLARPRSYRGEFHGLYTRDAHGRSEIRVWMFTAARHRVVRPRTFLRTLLHEVLHHLDLVRFGFPSSFHTLGFHARESALLRVLERSGARMPHSRDAGDGAVGRRSLPKPDGASLGPAGESNQLELFPDRLGVSRSCARSASARFPGSGD
jgi:hypothetical protein